MDVPAGKRIGRVELANVNNKNICLHGNNSLQFVLDYNKNTGTLVFYLILVK